MKILYIIFAFALTSCATSVNHSNGTLYRKYQEYKSAVELNDEVAVSKAVSKEYMEMLKEIDRKIPAELGFNIPLWKSLASDIVIEYSHFEEIHGESGCLTLNGLDKRDSPSSLSLYYIKENGNWVFNYFESSAHDSIKDYYTKPTCPSTEFLE
ncbi:MAG: hypothetical protein P8098_18895 [Candidatus Thiodiazotropha sp.]